MKGIRCYRGLNRDCLLIRCNNYDLSDLEIHYCQSIKCLEYDGSNLFIVIDIKKFKILFIHYNKLKVDKSIMFDRILVNCELGKEDIELLKDLFYDFKLCI